MVPSDSLDFCLESCVSLYFETWMFIIDDSVLHLHHAICIVWGGGLHIRMANVIHIEEGTKETRDRK